MRNDRAKKSKFASFEVRNRTIADKFRVWSVFIYYLFYPK